MQIPTVQNMESPRTGKPVANQFIIKTNDKQVFQSYDSIIAVKVFSNTEQTKYILDEKYWDYSATTLKYLKIFLGTRWTKRDIQYAIDHKTGLETADLNGGN